MRLILHTEFIIDSAHQLDGYKGKCKNCHGHTWRIEVWFKGSSDHCDRVGILVDFGVVKKLKDKMDHQYLNDVLKKNPTAENLTQFVYSFLKNQIKNADILVQVKVWETVIGKETWCFGGDSI